MVLLGSKAKAEWDLKFKRLEEFREAMIDLKNAQYCVVPAKTDTSTSMTCTRFYKIFKRPGCCDIPNLCSSTRTFAYYAYKHFCQGPCKKIWEPNGCQSCVI